MIVHLISSPRTVSTSLMYSFDNRPDTLGVDEPFYAYYLLKTGKPHPGRDTVLNEMPSDQENILAVLQKQSTHHAHLFIKNMAHHMTGLRLEPFAAFQNIFLIRDPKYVIHSLSKVWSPLDLLDIAVKEQWDLFVQLNKLDAKSIVVDSTDILRNPEIMIKAICASIELPFSSSMLSWNPGPRSIDGSWASYYYERTHQSCGFMPFEERNISIPAHHRQLLVEANKYYVRLKKYALKAPR